MHAARSAGFESSITASKDAEILMQLLTKEMKREKLQPQQKALATLRDPVKPLPMRPGEWVLREQSQAFSRNVMPRRMPLVAEATQMSALDFMKNLARPAEKKWGHERYRSVRLARLSASCCVT
jgi:hypothetical protein